VSKLVNLEVVSIEDGYAVLEAENGSQVEFDFEYLPPNLREGRFLKFVISHTDYNIDDEEVLYTSRKTDNYKKELPNGKLLSY
jgi:hypothetical protein